MISRTLSYVAISIALALIPVRDVLAASVPSASTRNAEVSVSFKGVKISLPVPAGYCALSRTKEPGKNFYHMQDSFNRGANVVALLFADCGELQLMDQDPTHRLRHFGSYLFQTPRGIERLWPEYTRESFIRGLSGTTIDSAGMKEKMNATIDATEFKEGNINSFSVRPIGVDANALYLAGASEVENPPEKGMICMVIGQTLIKQVSISMNLYDDYVKTASILELLQKQKAGMAALVAANN